MKRILIMLLGLVVLSAVAVALIYLGKNYKNLSGSNSNLQSEAVRLQKPASNELVTSPLTVEGEARGFWFFEASFPIRVLDANGKEIGASHAEALGEWMTTEFVPFRGTVAFQTPTTDTGTLVLEKDNPSGLPQNAAEVRYTIRFR